jgi:hypothetical protein
MRDLEQGHHIEIPIDKVDQFHHCQYMLSRLIEIVSATRMCPNEEIVAQLLSSMNTLGQFQLISRIAASIPTITQRLDLTKQLAMDQYVEATQS